MVAHYMSFRTSMPCTIPPKFTVPLAEQFRSEASRQFVRRFGSDETILPLLVILRTGRSMWWLSISTHYLPTQSLRPQLGEEGGFITELHVWCPYGLTGAETQVLLGIQRLIWKDGRYPVRPVLTTMSKEPPADLPLATGRVASKIWRTMTPFVPPRHYRRKAGSGVKVRESESPESQLIRYLRMAGVQTAGEVRRLGLADDVRKPLSSMPPMPLWTIVRAPEDQEIGRNQAVLSPVHTPAGDRARKEHHQRVGFFFEITFRTETALPMPAWGHSNHFGLGLMVPATEMA